jgi:hypothetical protein
MLRRALVGYEKVLGAEHPDTLTSVDHLGNVLERQGKYDEAEAMLRPLLRPVEASLPPYRIPPASQARCQDGSH